MEKEIEHKCKENKEEELRITSDSDGWWIEQDFYDNPTYLLKIKYCPFCGEKLGR